MANLPALPHEVLRQEILAEAEQQRTEILRQAEDQIRAIDTHARESSDRMREEVLGKARVEADRERDRLLASVAIEVRRLEQAHIESLLESICQEIRSRIQEGPGEQLRLSIASLCAQGIRGMKADRYVVRLSPSVHLLVQAEFSQDLRMALGNDLPTLTLTCDLEGNGVIVEASDGSLLWDNRLHARLDRLWPQLKQQIAREAGLVGSVDPGGQL